MPCSERCCVRAAAHTCLLKRSTSGDPIHQPYTLHAGRWARARLQQAAREAEQRARVRARGGGQLGRARLMQAAQRGPQRALQLVQHAAHAAHRAWVGAHLRTHAPGLCTLLGRCQGG